MSKQLLLIFLLLTCVARAQREYELRPFEDYTNCTTGFLNVKGDTIWPAQFDRVLKPISNSGIPAQGWIAVYQGYSGLLSSDGTIVLPFEYEDVRMSYEVDIYHAFKNQKIGLYNKDGKELYPLVIEAILSHGERSLIFQQEGKVGLLLNNTYLALPPIYDNIEEQFYYTHDPQSYPLATPFFLLEKNQQYGLADENGEVIFQDACCPFEILHSPIELEQPLIMLHSDKGVGLLNFQKEILIPPVNRDLELFTMEDQDNHPILCALIDVDDHSRKIVRIDRKLVSKTYSNLKIGKQTILFSIKNKQGYLDENLEEYFVQTSHELRLGAHPAYFSEEVGYSPDLPFIPGSSDQAVLVMADIEKKNKYRTWDKSYGLINVQTGKKIKPQFRTIYAKTEGNKVYYFAFDQLEEDGPSHLTVFDHQLEVIDTFTMDNGHWYNFNHFFYHSPTHPAFVFKDLNRKMGAINANGKTVIPFIYDDIRPQTTDDAESGIQGRLAVKIGGKDGVIDWQGKYLIPAEYDYIQVSPDHYQIAAKPNAYVLFDKDYNRVIADCQFITKTKASALKYFDRREDYNFRDDTFYAVKNDTAYAFFKEGFKPLNEKHYNHDHKINHLSLVGGRLLVEKNGHCILFKDYLNWASPNVYYFQERDSICFFHVDKGITVCTKQSSVNIGIDSYIHVNQYPNKEGLISKETGEWVLEPFDYFRILTDGKKGIHSQTDHFWYVMRGDEGFTHSMWIYDRLKQGKLERKFDVPTMNICGKYSIARSGGKYGILDSTYTEALPFDYKNIIYSYRQFFVKDFDNKWSAWSPEKGLVPLFCGDISLTKFTKGRLIFDGNRVAVVSDDFEFLLPFTPINALPDNVSLSDILGTMLRSNEVANWNKSLSDENSLIGRIYNNQTLCDLGLVFSTRHQVTEAQYLRNKTNSLSPVLVDEIHQQIFEERTLVFIGKRILSYEETAIKRNKANYLPNNNYKEFSWNDKKSTYLTFVLEDNRLRSATLDDLFLPGVNYIHWLDNYLTEYINRKQLFGLQCMNLPSILEEYKKHFHVERGGISFSLQNENKPVVIPWSALKGKIKEM